MRAIFMNISLNDGLLAELECDALVIPLDDGVSVGKEVDLQVAAMRKSGVVTGKIGC